MCIAETETRDYEVTYKKYKSAQENESGQITIVLKDYVESFNDDEFHLGQTYPDSQVQKEIQPLKEAYIMDEIYKVFGEKTFVSADNLDALIEEIDDDVEEILQEYEGYSNNDDEE